MAPNLVLLVSLFALLTLSAVAGPDQRLADARNRYVAPRDCATYAPCAVCADRTAILEAGRPPLPGEDGNGVRSCTLVNTSAEWDAYCADNVVPDCPLLDDAFFAQHTVVAVAVDTLTSRPCEGVSDPTWKLDCVTSSATVRVVTERPGGWCRCSAMPQRLQRLFLASAVPQSSATRCRACEESHRIHCLRN